MKTEIFETFSKFRNSEIFLKKIWYLMKILNFFEI
jgi:hypothetical protein